MDRSSFKKLFSPPFKSQIPNSHILYIIFLCVLTSVLFGRVQLGLENGEEKNLDGSLCNMAWMGFHGFPFSRFFTNWHLQRASGAEKSGNKNLQKRGKNIVGRKRFCHPHSYLGALVHGIQNGLSSHNNTCLCDILQNRRIYNLHEHLSWELLNLIFEMKSRWNHDFQLDHARSQIFNFRST